MEQFKGQSRLPKFAVPKRYDIRLKPDLNSCKFTGSVAIDVDIVAETRFLVLNVADISVRSDSVSLTKRNSSKVLVLRISCFPLFFWSTFEFNLFVLAILFLRCMKNQEF